MDFSKKDFLDIIAQSKQEIDENLMNQADKVRKKYYGNKVYLRALIEISNYCKNSCLYCGISASNKIVDRYRLEKDEILLLVNAAYNEGLRTIVLQGGEDSYYSDDILIEIIRNIKEKYDLAITLSLGERSKESFKKLYKAGADRYLLRHETANAKHYSFLHDNKLSFEDRKRALYSLKEIGFQTGAGMMIDSPMQKDEYLYEDLKFLKDLDAEMVGIGPFIAQKDSPFKDYKNASLNKTITMLALTRICMEKALIPSTTALASLDENGRKLGLKAGCNVIMPNVSPFENRKKYSLYDNKIESGKEVLEGLKALEKEVLSIGYNISYERGDYIGYQRLCVE